MTLAEIEAKLVQLLLDNKTTWKQSYILIRQVEREKLFEEAGYASFSSWLYYLAEKTGVNVRTLWRQKKAGRYYEDYYRRKEQIGSQIEPFQQVSISPDNLMLIEKISESHPWMEDHLMKRAIAGNISRNELNNTWISVKSERAEQGLRVARQTRHDKSSIVFSVEENLTASKLILVLEGNRSWISKRLSAQSQKYRVIPQFSYQKEGAFPMDACVIETITAKEDMDITLHGIRVVKSIDRLIWMEKEESCAYFDYTWAVIPESLKDQVLLQKTSKYIGIMVFKNQGTVSKRLEVLCKPKPSNAELKIKTMMKVIRSIM